MIKAVIFDCFGVLVDSSYVPFRSKYFAGQQDKLAEFSRLEDMSSKGDLEYSELIDKFAKLAGISVDLAVKELADNPVNTELFEYINASLKPSYKIGFLSNVGTDRVYELFTDDEVALFDNIVLSFQVGMAKPDARIYELAAERLGVEPHECVFVDDVEHYLAGAATAGMQTVHYTDYESFKESVAELL
ncbi:MAG: epoxide hydrolase-like predicted phosphatase [Candidatus Saccharimonadales bacterium]|jgi:epoxide hydrolase-like predicted phosphatase